MKKLIRYVCLSIVFSLLFTLPVWGTPYDKWLEQNPNILDILHSWDLSADYLGSSSYWKEHYHKDAPLPDPMLGDSNIDGKVDAVDALFALNFAVYGNVLTQEYCSGTRSPNAIRWTHKFNEAYYNNTLQELSETQDYKYQYCAYNSVFFADVNKDMLVNAADALEILKYAVGKEVKFSIDDFTLYHRSFAPYPWVDEYTPTFYSDLYSTLWE